MLTRAWALPLSTSSHRPVGLAAGFAVARLNAGALWLTTLCLLATLLGCGGKSMPQDAVIMAGSVSITKPELSHMMSVIAAQAGVPGRPTLEIPDPPNYTRCIAYKRAYPPAPPPTGGSQPNVARLRAECQLLYERVKLKAIYSLLSFAWLSGKAKELGVHASRGMVSRRFAQLKQSFPSEAAFKRYLAVEHLTPAELLRGLRLAVLTTLIQQKVEANAGVRDSSEASRTAALRRFAHAFKSEWKAKTSCRAGFVVPACEQYRPPKKRPILTPPHVSLTE